MRQITELEAASALVGHLPKGCTRCGPGRKMVLLVTGKCGNACYYCPLSEKKKGMDVVYANEMLVKREDDIIQEAELINAEGCSMTGGDPVCELERTVEYIKLLKSRFGEKFHIHLYTALFSSKKIETLASAGLDEIRFHPYPLEKIDLNQVKAAISTSLDSGMSTGFEIPMLPGGAESVKALISWLDKLEVEFINLNELEFSHTNWHNLEARGLKPVSDIEWGVQGSRDAAIEILEWGRNLDISIHFCSSRFKDAIQLRNRLRNRAVNIARDGDVITDDGLLLKGVVEADNPSQVIEELKRVFGIPDNLIYHDAEKNRVELAPWLLEEIASELDYDCYIVEEYPTADRLETERSPLR